MIESKLAFLQVQYERAFGDAVELGQASLGIAPEAFDAVDMVGPFSEMIFAVADAQVSGIAQVDETVIARQAIGQDRRIKLNMAANNGLERYRATIGHDLGEDALTAFEHAEDDRFLERAAPTLASDTPRTEERFVDFDFALKRRLARAFFGHAASNREEQRVDAAHAQAG